MKNNQGFTLVEVIISIAVLSIVSVIFLQLFVKAKEIDESSYSLDKSVMVSNTLLENVKGIRDVSGIRDSNVFKEFTIEETKDGFTFLGYYDAKFNIVDKLEGLYVLTMEFSLLSESKDEMVGLYNINLSVDSIEKDKEIMQINVKIVLGK